MNRTLTAALGTVLFVFSSTASVAKTCVIVVAADRQSSLEIYQHEIAHCNGWTHPNRTLSKVKKAFVPPVSFIKEYKDGELQVHWVSSKEAMRICNSFGCQWFEWRLNDD